MSLINIPIEEIDFHPTSHCDRRGRLFWWQGQLYRGISLEYAEFYQNLFDNGIIEKLIAKKLLIDTELTNFSLNNYPLILKHQRLPFVSYANEWCPEMLRDASLLNLELTLELINLNLSLTDAATWNILFNGYSPIMVDFCSIESLNYQREKNWRIYTNDFYSYFIYPLQLMAQGYGNLARWLLANCEHEVVSNEFAMAQGMLKSKQQTYSLKRRLFDFADRNLPNSLRPLAQHGLQLFRSTISSLATHKSGLDVVKKLKGEIDNISLFYQKIEPNLEENLLFTPSNQWTSKHNSVNQVLSDLNPATVLDIGTGDGWYAQLAALSGSKVVALDIDESKVSQLYREAQQKNLSILPLVMDIQYPTPGQGINYKVSSSALERFPCDLVMALALVHILVFTNRLTFPQITEMLATLSQKWLLIEFISAEDAEIQESRLDLYTWYNLDNLKISLKKWFNQIEMMPSDSELRTLLLCSK